MDNKKGKFDDIKSGLLNKISPSCNQRPPMYKLFIAGNSDIPNEFISHLIKNIFHKNTVCAIQAIDNIDSGQNILCGLYTRDVAETKQSYIEELARGNGYSLKCIMQEGERDVIKES